MQYPTLYFASHLSQCLAIRSSHFIRLSRSLSSRASSARRPPHSGSFTLAPPAHPASHPRPPIQSSFRFIGHARENQPSSPIRPRLTLSPSLARPHSHSALTPHSSLPPLLLQLHNSLHLTLLTPPFPFPLPLLPLSPYPEPPPPHDHVTTRRGMQDHVPYQRLAPLFIALTAD